MISSPRITKLIKVVQGTSCWPLSTLLEQFGPQVGRPRVDTLNSSRHANMNCGAADSVWRFAFAFDPKRRAILLCGGDKSVGGEKRFYQQLIGKADERFDAHLVVIKK